jgi:hypothetical protein
MLVRYSPKKRMPEKERARNGPKPAGNRRIRRSRTRNSTAQRKSQKKTELDSGENSTITDEKGIGMELADSWKNEGES